MVERKDKRGLRQGQERRKNLRLKIFDTINQVQ